jgi:hypothetical protein
MRKQEERKSKEDRSCVLTRVQEDLEHGVMDALVTRIGAQTESVDMQEGKYFGFGEEFIAHTELDRILEEISMKSGHGDLHSKQNFSIVNCEGGGHGDLHEVQTTSDVNLVGGHGDLHGVQTDQRERLNEYDVTKDFKDKDILPGKGQANEDIIEMRNTTMANTFDNDTNTQYETPVCTQNLPTFDLEMRNELGEEPEVMDSAMEPRQREQYSTCARIGNELGEEPEVVDSAMEPRQRNELDKTHQHVSKKDIEINYTVPGPTSRANPPNKARFQERLGGGMKVPGQVDKSKEKDSKVVVNTIFGKEKEKKQITKMASIFEKKSKVNKVDSAKTNTKEATTNEQRQKQEQSTPTRRKAVAIRRKCNVISEGLVQLELMDLCENLGHWRRGTARPTVRGRPWGKKSTW